MISDPNKPVQNEEDFFGQKGVIKKIFSRIGAGRPQSVAIIGGRKIGKTSLLNYINMPAVRERFLENPGAYLFKKVDLPNNAISDSKPFLKLLCGLCDESNQTDENCYSVLQHVIEKNHNQGKKIIFLLDDFHLITSNKKFPLEFFSFLRSLANNYNLAYITTSFLELQKLCVVKDIEDSPFFNIFTNLSLSLLQPNSAIRLLIKITGIEENVAREIVDFSGTSPYVIKLLCQQIANNNDKILNVEEEGYLEVLYDYFTDIISILPSEAFKPLRTVARDRNPDQRELYNLRPLIKQGFLLEDEDNISCFSPVFKAFLKKNLSNKMLKGREQYLEMMERRV